MPKSPLVMVGNGGCCGNTTRGGGLRKCAQKAIVERGGKPYCYYHDPKNPKRFGQGY
jgi:hypothetical protein